MSEFKREERYIVVKLKHLAGLQVAPLRNFLRENHVPTLDCVVVESDWPEYDKVWQSIERRMTGQPPVTAAEELEAVLHWRNKHAIAIKERDALLVREAELTQELERQKRYVEINANSAQGKHAEGQRYRDERDALQLRLTETDQRNDEMAELMQGLIDNPFRLSDNYRARMAAALKPKSKPEAQPDFSMIGIERMPPMEYDEP